MNLVRRILSHPSRRVNELAKAIARLYFLATRGDYWHFAAIYVETAQHCNRSCSYCPQSIAPMPKAFMSDDDFFTACDRIIAHDWHGPVILSRFGEPMLDPKLDNRIAKMRDITRHVQIFSNGDLLTLDRANRLVDAGLSLCKLTKHKPYREDFDERIGRVMALYPKQFVLLNPITEPYSLGGLTPFAEPFNSCALPSWAFIINPNLDICLCCHDYSRDVVVGNLKRQTINEVWNSPAFVRTRKELRQGVFRHDVCLSCASGPSFRRKFQARLTATK